MQSYVILLRVLQMLQLPALKPTRVPLSISNIFLQKFHIILAFYHFTTIRFHKLYDRDSKNQMYFFHPTNWLCLFRNRHDISVMKVSETRSVAEQQVQKPRHKVLPQRHAILLQLLKFSSTSFCRMNSVESLPIEITGTSLIKIVILGISVETSRNIICPHDAAL